MNAQIVAQKGAFRAFLLPASKQGITGAIYHHARPVWRMDGDYPRPMRKQAREEILAAWNSLKEKGKL